MFAHSVASSMRVAELLCKRILSTVYDDTSTALRIADPVDVVVRGFALSLQSLTISKNHDC